MNVGEDREDFDYKRAEALLDELRRASAIFKSRGMWF